MKIPALAMASKSWCSADAVEVRTQAGRLILKGEYRKIACFGGRLSLVQGVGDIDAS